MKYCHKCGALVDLIGQPSSRDTCPACRADLRVCLNCRFYDVSKSNQCFANVEDPVLYKDRSTHCDEFQFIERQSPLSAERSSPQKAKQTFKDLFRK